MLVQHPASKDPESTLPKEQKTLLSYMSSTSVCVSLPTSKIEEKKLKYKRVGRKFSIKSVSQSPRSGLLLRSVYDSIPVTLDKKHK